MRALRWIMLGGLMSCEQKTDTPVVADTKVDPALATVASPPPASVAPRDNAASGTIEGRLWFAVGTDTILVLKVADRNHLLSDGHSGDKELRRALKQDKLAGMSLLYLVVPNDLTGAKFHYQVGEAKQELSDPAMIYRMSRSPRYTFAVVRADQLGRIEVSVPDGRTGAIALGEWASELDRMPLYRDKTSGFVSYRGAIPFSFYGKMPPSYGRPH